MSPALVQACGESCYTVVPMYVRSLSLAADRVGRDEAPYGDVR
jgi:hypothetical protein